MRFFFGILFAFCVVFNCAFASERTNDLKTLLQTRVTSVSKKEEEVFDAAAALYVVTKNDIKNSGATNLPEILRMVPGLHVARSDSSGWIVTSRGFKDNGFANKLLVLIDGRSVYTPLFSGVYWDVQNIVLDNIERIEVIRGPGASLWGANAVNGVINVITKSAEQTQGNLVALSVGTNQYGEAIYQYGGETKNDLYFRNYLKADNYGETILKKNGNDANDPWYDFSSGFRVDSTNKSNTKYVVQGDIYQGVRKFDIFVPNYTLPAYEELRHEELDVYGGNILAKYDLRHDNGSQSTFQAYFDRASRSYSRLDQDINSFDLDYQNVFNAFTAHEMTIGAEYRLIDARTKGSDTLYFTPAATTYNMVSGFFQDKIELSKNILYLTYGSKFEYNDLSGFEYQPSARLSYKPNNKNLFWAAISRSVRTPSIAEEGSKAAVHNAKPGILWWHGIHSRESENIMSYEIGQRKFPLPSLYIDNVLFYSEYDSYPSFEDPDQNGIYDIGNNTKARSFGFESALNYEPDQNWKFKLSYSYLNVDIYLPENSTDVFVKSEENSSPRSQVKLFVNTLLPFDCEMNNNFYYNSKVGAAKDTPAYLRYDFVLNWHPVNNIDVSVVGQNLLSDSHQEYSEPLQGEVTEIPRSYFGKVTFRF